MRVSGVQRPSEVDAHQGLVRRSTLRSQPSLSPIGASMEGHMSTNDVFSSVDTGGAFGESGPMSALLAENWWAIALRGVFGILFGIIALLMPGITIEAFVLLFAAYMLVDGIFAIVAGVRAAAHHERWGALILQGILDLIAAAIAIF